MNFIKFHKIYEKIEDYKINNKELKKVEWIATEKIHGSNFSIYINDKSVKCAKRNGFLEKDDVFYDYKYVIKNNADKLRKLYKILKEKHKFNYIIIYNELFGGWFPENAKNWEGPIKGGRISEDSKIIIPQNLRAIQEGIYYSNQVDIIILDIVLVTLNGSENDADTSMSIYGVPYNEIVKIVIEVGLKVTMPLVTGKLEKIMNYDINFDSTIPKYLGYPHIEHNTAEGIVIRPIDYNQSGFCSIKIKNNKFSEICNVSSFNKFETGITPKSLLMGMINVNRLNNVLSKSGIELNQDNKQKILKDFIEDVITDYHINYYETPITNYSEINEFLNKTCLDLIEFYTYP
jgi:Rnl2 family RNA ligase